MHDKAHHWNEKYLAGTTGWDRGETSPALHAWLESGELLPGRILIPGCGYGHEAVELARRGFDVTALDIAPAPLKRLEQELKAAGVTATLVQADALDWQADPAFDAIYEQTCLCALDPAHWQAYEAQLHAWLKPGGKFFALFMQTGREGGPPFHCALPDMRALFPEARWHWEGQPHKEVPHPNGLFEYAAVLTRI
jgi:SAM-dependent methyltransferase